MSAALVALAALLACPAARAGEVVHLGELDLSKMSAGWGRPQVDRSVQEKPLSIGGVRFERGVGTHARSLLWIELAGQAQRFSAKVGVDDEVGSAPASIAFRVVADGRTLFHSGRLRAGEPAKEIDVDLRGTSKLVLIVDPTDDGIDFDHADWAEARLEYGDTRPAAIDPPREDAVILTPAPPHAPRMHSPRRYGVRPGRPFLLRIPTTGDRPIAFSAQDLPAGLALDGASGIITGRVAERGVCAVMLRAENSRGRDERLLEIVVGDRIALTPPMGWNSWYAHLDGVSDGDIRAAADALVATGLADHGYTYVGIDDGWMVKPGSEDPLLGGEPRDADGAIRANGKFPDMHALADYVHAKGLKIGLYTSPGPRTCAGYAGSLGHEDADARRFAQWGFDLLKYDWCSYGEIARGQSRGDLMAPYLKMGAILAGLDRDLLLNLCQYGMGKVWEWGRDVGGHSWRTTGDLGLPGQEQAQAMFRIGFSHDGLAEHAGPGGWNDPDYLMLGPIRDYRNWSGPPVPTSLSPNEQRAHLSLWCLLAAPLFIGGDVTRLDAFTLALLSNDEVIEIDQDPLGRAARRIAQGDGTQVWSRPLEDGSLAVGLFNLDEFESEVSVSWQELGVEGRQRVRDLWRQTDLGEFEGRFSTPVGRHGAVLVRVTRVVVAR